MMQPGGGIDFNPAYRDYRYANMGGPMSRTCRLAVCSTLLGNDDRPIRCPRVVRLGLGFPDGDPVALVTQVLNGQGFAVPQDLLDEFEIPMQRLVARPHTLNTGVVELSYDAPRDVLWQALMLGLCTAQLYDPRRPVLWTQTALRRRLELFDPAGFYA